jgi:uncharacterized membrane protein
MTETMGHGDLGARINHALQKLGRLLGKAGFGIFLVFAAIAALVATTVIGLMLAIAAVFLSFARRPSRRNGGDPDTLEARRTADGWVIEG